MNQLAWSPNGDPDFHRENQTNRLKNIFILKKNQNCVASRVEAPLTIR